MKTIEQLKVELLMLKQKITEQRDAERRERNEMNATRRRAERLALKYDIKWEDDSYRESGEYNHLHWFPQPEWLEGDDPLGDGHHAYNWDETLWLVEFYAKHNPEHPDYEHREFLKNSPWC